MNNFQQILIRLCEKDYFSTMDFLSEEAATVAREDNYQFTIYPEPLGNPSFHVRYKDEWEVVLELFSFKILENKFGQFKKGSVLPKKIMKDIFRILNEKNDIGVLTWQFLLKTWNVNNPKYKVDVNFSLPIK